MEDLEGGFLASSQKPEYTGIKTLRHLTAKQINNIALDDSSSIMICDRFEVSNLQLIGYVGSTKKISTGLVFELNDTTSLMDCTMWSNTAIDDFMMDLIVENSLIKVSGVLKTFGNKKTLNVTSVSPANLNLLIYHLTSSLYQHLHFTNKLTVEEKKASLTFSKIQSDILEVYRSNQDEYGLDIEIVVAMLKDKFSENDIKNNVELLVSNYHLIPCDDNNYKTAV